MLAACGSEGGGGAQPSDLEALPRGLVVEAFAAGDDEAWLMASSGGEGRLFAVRPDGVVRTTYEGDPHALGLEAFRGGAVVTNLRCEDGSSATSEGCDAVEGVVSFVGDGGVVEGEVVVWAEDGMADDSDGIALLGTSGSAAWVDGEGHYLEVVPGEGIVTRAPQVDGTVACVVDDRLYAVGPRGAEVPAAWRWEGHAWVEVDGRTGPATTSEPTTRMSMPAASSTADSPGPPTAPETPLRHFSCQRDAVDVTDVGDDARLLGRWTPDGGYVAADPAGGPPPERPTTAIEGRGAFAVDAEGRLLERGHDGHFRPTGIDLAGFEDPWAWPRLHAAGSTELVAACIGAGDSTTCQLARRDGEPP